MKHLVLLLSLFSIAAFGQLNDTIVFKTGYEKVVEIESFDMDEIKYLYYNKKLDTTKSYKTPSKQVKYFVIYDEELVKTYDSRIDYTGNELKPKVDSLKVAEHDLSVNPFLIALLSPSVRYTYKFGNYMQYGVNARFTYYSPLIFNAFGSGSGILMIGAGFRFMPYYSRKLCFGLDLTPMFLAADGDWATYIPINFDFDFYFGDRFGIALDLGAGYGFGNGFTGFAPRGHLGFLIRMGKRYNVPNASNSVK